MRKFLSATIIVVLFSIANPAYAQLGYYRPGEPVQKTESSNESGKNVLVVTSTEECYAQLDPQEAEKIRQNYSKPYRECLKRLANKKQKKLEVTTPENTEEQTSNQEKDKGTK